MKKKRGRPKYHQGYFTPMFPEKYIGDVNDIYYRSGLELKFMRFFDLNSAILKWNSEGVVIPYFDLASNKKRRYFVDFYIKLKDINNNIKEFIVEIKPYNQTKAKKAKTEYAKEQYKTNISKWNAAKNYAAEYNLEFIILTEKDLK